MASLDALFNDNLNWWNEHCEEIQSSSSRIGDYLDCDGYKHLVILGKCKKKEVLRLIKDNYTEIPLGVATLVKEIMGNDFQIPKEMIGKIKQMEAYTLGWLTGHLE